MATPVFERGGLAGTSAFAAAASAAVPSGASLRSTPALRLGGSTPTNAPASTASTVAWLGSAAAPSTATWLPSAGRAGCCGAAEPDGAGGSRSAGRTRLLLSPAAVALALLPALGSEAVAAAPLELSCMCLPPGDAGGLLASKNDLQAVSKASCRTRGDEFV